MATLAGIRILKDIEKKIVDGLARVGLLCRVFSRVKSAHSLEEKISRSPGKYYGGKSIQDVIGIRVALYFSDDCDVAESLIKKIFSHDPSSSSIDVPGDDKFSAVRRNLIFRIPEESREEFSQSYSDYPVDNTFEVQIRSILSEGWHEVEHDLRYKCKNDWIDYGDLNRALNGIYAVLETSDWAIRSLFSDLTYRYYKDRKWSQMIRSKFRLRVLETVSEDLCAVFDKNVDVAKAFLRVDRMDFLIRLQDLEDEIPLTMNNIIFMCNFWYVNSGDVGALAPLPIVKRLAGKS